MAFACTVPEFEEWMRGVGISWDGIQVVDGGTAHGWGVFATRSLNVGHAMCQIPKTAILSVVNTGIADILEKERIRGGLGVVAAALYEQSLGQKSRWYGYLRSLPHRVYLPVFWSDSEQELLAGTELDGRVHEDVEHMESDWQSTIAPLADKYPDRIDRSRWTWERFCAAASWVSSRVFRVDDLHGDALVPLADIFNHKASIVQIGDEYAVAGSEDTDGDGSEDEAEQPAGPQLAHTEQAGSGTSHQNAAPTDKQSKKRGRGAEAALAVNPPVLTTVVGHDEPHPYTRHRVDLRLDMAVVDSTNEEGVEVLDILAGHGLSEGQEVFNTYGEHGDSELVHRWGFALGRSNPFTEVQLDAGDVVECALEVLTEQVSVCQGQDLNWWSDYLAAPQGGKKKSKIGKAQGKNGQGAGMSVEAVTELVSEELQRRVAWVQESSSLIPHTGGEDTDSDHDEGESEGEGESQEGEQEDAEEGAPNDGADQPESSGDHADHSHSDHDHDHDSHSDSDSDSDAAGSKPDEVQDPLCVLPAGHVNTSTWLLLSALCAPQSQFQQWCESGLGVQGILSAAQPPRDTRTGTAGAAADERNGHDHGSDHSCDEGDGAQELMPLKQLDRAAVQDRFSHAVEVPPLSRQSGKDVDTHLGSTTGRAAWTSGALPSQCAWHCAHQTDGQLHSLGASGYGADVTVSCCALVCPVCCHAASPRSTVAGSRAVCQWTGTMQAVLQRAILRRLQLYARSTPVESSGTGGQAASKGGRKSRTAQPAKQQAHAKQLQPLQDELSRAVAQLGADRTHLQQAQNLEGEAGQATRGAVTLRVCEQEALLSVFVTVD